MSCALSNQISTKPWLSFTASPGLGILRKFLKLSIDLSAVKDRNMVMINHEDKNYNFKLINLYFCYIPYAISAIALFILNMKEHLISIAIFSSIISLLGYSNKFSLIDNFQKACSNLPIKEILGRLFLLAFGASFICIFFIFYKLSDTLKCGAYCLYSDSIQSFLL